MKTIKEYIINEYGYGDYSLKDALLKSVANRDTIKTWSQIKAGWKKGVQDILGITLVGSILSALSTGRNNNSSHNNSSSASSSNINRNNNSHSNSQHNSNSLNNSNNSNSTSNNRRNNSSNNNAMDFIANDNTLSRSDKQRMQKFLNNIGNTRTPQEFYDLIKREVDADYPHINNGDYDDMQNDELKMFLIKYGYAYMILSAGRYADTNDSQYSDDNRDATRYLRVCSQKWPHLYTLFVKTVKSSFDNVSNLSDKEEKLKEYILKHTNFQTA